LARRPPGSRRRLPRERRRDRRARPARGSLSRAEALYEAEQDTEAVEAFEPLVAAARATGMPELQVRALAGSGLAKMRTGEHRAAVELSTRHARSPRPSRSRTSSGRTFCSGSGAAATSSRASRRRSRSSTRRSARRAFRPALRRAQGEHPLVALAAGSASGTSRQPATTSSGRSSARCRRPAHHRRRLLRASLIADREGHWVLARNHAERARRAQGSSPTASMSAS
jgi:hypothetical protein